MPESLSANEVGKEIAEHREHAEQATQIRTLDSVSFNAAETACASHDTTVFDLTLRRMRPGYLPAVRAWLALHPLKNPQAPPDRSYMPQYKIPQETQAASLNTRANAYFSEGVAAAGTDPDAHQPAVDPSARAGELVELQAQPGFEEDDPDGDRNHGEDQLLTEQCVGIERADGTGAEPEREQPQDRGEPEHLGDQRRRRRQDHHQPELEQRFATGSAPPSG